MATAFGEVYQYTLEGGGLSGMDLKTVQEWQVRYALRTVPGVNEVNTWGGETQQYHVVVDPVALQRYGLVLRDVFERIRENNSNFGAGFIEHSGEQYTVRGLGRAIGPEDLERIVVKARAGTPVLLRDVARMEVGAMQRQGANLRDGKGETVSGMVIMLKGENGKQVIERVKEKLASLRLPEGVKINPFYDQSTVIDATIHTVRKNLLEGGALVIMVLLLFLGNFRAALIVAAVIPLSMLVGFIGMKVFGISANLMSLGAIDFGMIVDGAVVMMENSMRRLDPHRPDVSLSVTERVRQAAHEVARPILFAVAIIIAVYMPIFFLEGLEGRMFRPMAITVCAALFGSLIFALTVVPAASAITFRNGVKEHKQAWFEWLRDRYVWALRLVLRFRVPVVATSVVVLVLSIGSLWFIGTEFMARLDEGSILIETQEAPGHLTHGVCRKSALASRRIIKAFPEVTGVVTRIGRPDVATEAMGIYQGDVYVLLKPRSEWQRFHAKEELIGALDRALSVVPGVSYNFTQPMAMRLDETISGIKADVALKIFGEDPLVLEQLAQKALRVVSSTPGSADAQMEIISGVAELQVQVDRTALARYGLNVADVRDITQAAVSGQSVSEIIQGQRRFDVVVRLPEQYRQNVQAIRELLISAPGGELVPLGNVANVTVARGPEVISRESRAAPHRGAE